MKCLKGGRGNTKPGRNRSKKVSRKCAWENDELVILWTKIFWKGLHMWRGRSFFFSGWKASLKVGEWFYLKYRMQGLSAVFTSMKKSGSDSAYGSVRISEWIPFHLVRFSRGAIIYVLLWFWRETICISKLVYEIS